MFEVIMLIGFVLAVVSVLTR